MSYIQVAIAFEALYGGDKGQPVVETLANRVAYSLGESSGERINLHDTFVNFYNKRSDIVHNGATQLAREDRDGLLWARAVLTMALLHEFKTVGPLPGDTAAVARYRRLNDVLTKYAR